MTVLAAATATDALAGGLVVLAVFIAGLYWQEETRAQRDVIQRVRTFTIALASSGGFDQDRPDELNAPAVTVLASLAPGGLGTVVRCGRRSMMTWWTGAAAVVALASVGVAVAGRGSFDGYLAVFPLVVLFVLGVAGVARWQLHRQAVAEVCKMRVRIDKELACGRPIRRLHALLLDLTKDLDGAGCGPGSERDGSERDYIFKTSENHDESRVYVASIMRRGTWRCATFNLGGSKSRILEVGEDVGGTDEGECLVVLDAAFCDATRIEVVAMKEVVQRDFPNVASVFDKRGSARSSEALGMLRALSGSSADKLLEDAETILGP